MKYVDNWEETKNRFEAWWNHSKMDRPLMNIVARRKELLEPLEVIIKPSTPEEFHLDVENNIKDYRNYCKSSKFMAESFPNFNLNIGAGSLALYLGSEPIFAYDTIWFKECVEDWDVFGDLKFNRDNYWWKRHLELMKKAQELSNGDFLINIPDLVENVDILSSLRGPQDFCYDLIDQPEVIKKYVEQVDDLYFKYYDAMYDIIKAKDGSSTYNSFSIWGEGKVAKVQSDFSALMSPNQFREFVQPSLIRQCKNLNHTLYHLDGKDAIKHLDALMEIDDLDAVQWTPGAGRADGGSEEWYPIYEKVRAANKGLWISISDGDFTQWVDSCNRIVKRFGSDGMYFHFPLMEEELAIKLIKIAERDWR